MIKKILLVILPFAIAIMVIRTSAGLSTEFDIRYLLQLLSETEFMDIREFTDAMHLAADSFNFVEIKDFSDFWANIGIFFESIWKLYEAIGTLLVLIITNIVKTLELIVKFLIT